MADHKNSYSCYSGRVYRALSGLFGLFLTGIGIYVIFYGVVSPSVRISMGFLIALLGAETVYSVVKSRPSWLAKIGSFF